MFDYKEKELYVDAVPLRRVCAEFGTPVYVYSASKVRERVASVLAAIRRGGARVHFPVKCNFNLSVLDLLRREGLAFDVASEGELRRVLRIGADPSQMVFTGVGKSTREIELGMDVGIGCFHVESKQELERIEAVAYARNARAPVSMRVNADVATRTHAYNALGSGDTKFGIPLSEAEEAYQYAHDSEHLLVRGIHCHIGSQITEVKPYETAISAVLEFVKRLEIDKGIRLEFFDVGGGFGVRYKQDDPFLKWDEWLEELVRPIWDAGLEVHLEPGRVLVAEAGVLVTEALYVKKMSGKNYVIVDAAMNDFIRPALYDGYHEILNVRQRDEDGIDDALYDVVGPLCESSDVLGLQRRLSVAQGDFLAVTMAGAYGSAIMSNFSSRPRPPEVMVDGDRVRLIKERETHDHVMGLDRIVNMNDE